MPPKKRPADYNRRDGANLNDVTKELWQAAVKRVLSRRGVRVEDFDPLVGSVLVQAEALYAGWPLEIYA